MVCLEVHASPGKQKCSDLSSAEACPSSVLIQRDRTRPAKLTKPEEESSLFGSIMGAFGGGTSDSHHDKPAKGDKAASKTKEAVTTVISEVGQTIPQAKLTNTEPIVESQAPSPETEGAATIVDPQGSAPLVEDAASADVAPVDAKPVDMSALSDDTLKSIVATGDEDMMSLFVQKMVAAFGLQETSKGTLSKISAKQMSGGSYASLVKGILKMRGSALTSKVKEMRGDKAPISEDGYKAVAQMNSNPEMLKFIRRVAGQMSMAVTSDGGSLDGVAPWYSGVRAVQSLAKLKQEITDQSTLENGWAFASSGDPTGAADSAGAIDPVTGFSEGDRKSVV